MKKHKKKCPSYSYKIHHSLFGVPVLDSQTGFNLHQWFFEVKELVFFLFFFGKIIWQYASHWSILSNASLKQMTRPTGDLFDDETWKMKKENVSKHQFDEFFKNIKNQYTVIEKSNLLYNTYWNTDCSVLNELEVRILPECHIHSTTIYYALYPLI